MDPTFLLTNEMIRDIVEQEFDVLHAKSCDKQRQKERQKLVTTGPRRILVREIGDGQQMFDLIRYYQAPVTLDGGRAGIRLRFARMNEAEAWWKTTDGAMLYRYGAEYILRPYDGAATPLRLSFDGTYVKRLHSHGPSQVIELRSKAAPRGRRLA